MAKKARQRIAYVLESPDSSRVGHRLGVNGLAVDPDNDILYSGGRDGVICAWDLNLKLGSSHHSAVTDTSSSPPTAHTKGQPAQTTRFRAETQAHTHWVNDLALAQNHNAVVSASSDQLVKVWRPHSSESKEPAIIGQHADYVKCVATPDQNTDWVATGGLDRKIYLWDLAGGGKSLEFDMSGEEVKEKGSVYALAVNHNIIASGGPESIVRLWDPRSGQRISKFVGHTDMIRAILMNKSGDKIISASSDNTIKVWSVAAGRCMSTLTMHNASVWSLFSEDPELDVFYSGDRDGWVFKTDVRGTQGEWDNGLSLAVAHESVGFVFRVVACGDHIWTATPNAWIHRWGSIDTGADIQLPESFKQHRASMVTSLPPSSATAASKPAAKKEISPKSVLRISNTASFPPAFSRDVNDSVPDSSDSAVEPIHQVPEETIQGQSGLVKYRLLNDRRRVLTLDTASNVLLWDLIQCRPIQSFGTTDLNSVEPQVNKLETVSPWCNIDISSGNLTVVLEPFNWFDAEMYADELILDEPVEFREDQRSRRCCSCSPPCFCLSDVLLVNLGKWVLRYLFGNLIDEEIRRDEAYRQKLNEAVEQRNAAGRANPLPSITIPQPAESEPTDSPVTTPRPSGSQYPPSTPGPAIGLATPGAAPPLPGVAEGIATPLSPLDKRSSQASRPSVEKEDYFTNAISSADASQSGAKPAQTPAPSEPATADDKVPKTPGDNGGKDKDKDVKDKDKDNGKAPSTPFAKKKFRMGMSFGTKKLGRSASTAAAEKPAVVDEKTEEASESSSNHEKEFEDNFLGVVQRIRHEYEKQLAESPEKFVETKIAPSLPNDTPVLKLPPGTKVIIQEETSGGSAELYRGTVETVGQPLDVETIEQRGPHWLGELLLLNTIPQKEPVKVSFVLHPWKDELPPVSTTNSDGNNRLNANRMLRVRKILAYVAERIDPPADPENPDPDAMKPEEYLELYCNEQLLPNNMTLSTLRAHVWKGGNDIVLYYKANGKKEIPIRPPEPVAEETAEPAASAEATTA
ncbi:hypothetical protein QBC46DRAFT_281881 [Diplogelasinospora grovesii]|uniref:Uncharacterized protein n=1 Tax=Diplogelasinospora grovesii TaxID=303347 RepID=A0AAN6NED4_9PEZI|nr:hypothetical protein QBC46DRAFT_281881 [Diplogelasinospora grovesii]